MDDFRGEIPSSVDLKLKELGVNKTRITGDGSMPFMIVRGSNVYKVEATTDRIPQHPGTWSTLKCIKGC